MATILVDDTTPGFYNAAIGTVLDGTQPQFPLANSAGGDPTIVPAPEPDLSAAADALGDWLAPDPFPLNANWTGPQTIPRSWVVNTETAIIYVIDAGPAGISELTGNFGVDNGIFVWVNGVFKFGAVEPGYAIAYEYAGIDLGSLPPGHNVIQVLREDHGNGDDYLVQIAGKFAPGDCTGTPEDLGGGEPGCIPPNRAVLGCANRVNRNAAQLATALLRCHTKLAAAARAATSFDEEGCEAAAQAKYEAANAKLRGCPACLDSAAVADEATSLIETTATGALYCDGTSGVALGESDDASFVPADDAAATCEKKAAHALWRFIAIEVNCHATLATDDVAGAPFDVETCESAAEIRFASAVAALAGCPACVTTQLPMLTSATAAALDQQSSATYCTP